MASLQPFCIASSNGTVYAVSFAYDLRFTTTSSYPDTFVLIKGSTPTGLRQDMNWTAMSSARRTDVGIFPEPIFPYSHVCGVSRDGSLFILHSAGPVQAFSVHIPIRDSNVITPVWTVQDFFPNSSVTDEVSSWERGPSLLMPTVDFNSENATALDGAEFGDWMHLSSLQSDLVIFRSNNSFPLSPQKSFKGMFPGVDDLTANALGIAYANKELYLLSSTDQRATVRSMPFEYNATNPNWFDTNSSGVVVSEIEACIPFLYAMTVLDNFVYVVCSQSNDNPSQATFTIINPRANTTQSFSINVPSFHYRRGYGSPPSLVPISHSTFLLSDGIKLFWIDTTDGHPTIDIYTPNPLRQFTFNNQNPDMTSEPLTFSGTDTFAIVVGCLVLAALLVFAQRLFFKWRASNWVDDSDIPGSKVAEEVQDESHVQSSDGFQSPLSLYVPPSYSDMDITRTNSHTSMTPLSTTGDRSPGLRADELELVPFSSHPRPNVVTTITDGSSEDTNVPRE